MLNNILTYSSRLDLAVVVDIILDESHPYFNETTNEHVDNDLKKILPVTLPNNYNDNISDSGDIDYTYIGRVKVRILNDESRIDDFKLKWAIPIQSSLTQYPLLNETVLVIKIGNNLYYTNAFNQYNFGCVNANYSIEAGLSKTNTSSIPEKYKEFIRNFDEDNVLKISNKQSYISPPTHNNPYLPGYLGERFILNPYIRSLKRYEGDSVFEGRFGQSIRMGGYNNTNDDIDKISIDGIDELTGERLYRKDSSYFLKQNIYPKSSYGGYGNPVIYIRNRQRDLSTNNEKTLHPLLPSIPSILDIEKNFGGYIEEDINHDGSTIEINSGIRKTKWVTTCYKSMFGFTEDGDPTEEQSKYNPKGSTPFTFPILWGDQIVINTDRLILSSRFGETFHFSKKRYGIVTDNEYTVDANDQIVLTTNGVTCLNSPQVFLGQYGETNEPALLGQTSVDWLYDLCNWLLNHTHWYHHVHPYPHTHPDAGRENPSNTINAEADQTQAPVQQLKLKLLRDNLHKLLSRRIFLTGGGYAPGSDGVKPKNSNSECMEPIKINVVSGDGVLGTFKGENRREGITYKTF